MDIEEYKKLARNKIEADALTKQVRDVIKETKWQKQDMREGFTETFKPLIKSQESVKKSIDEQQNATIAQLQANQLALTQGLNQNRLALTDGLNQNRFALTKALEDINKSFSPSTSDPSTSDPSTSDPSTSYPSIGEKIRSFKFSDSVTKELEKSGEASVKGKDKIAIFNEDDLNKYLTNKERIDILKNYGYDNLPYYYLDKDIKDIENLMMAIQENLSDLKNDLRNTSIFYQNTEGYILAKSINLSPQKKTLVNINDYNALSTYYKNLSDLYNYKKKIGSGITLFNNPHQLLDRLELLGGSILAGNNGVIPEFSKLAHLLNQMKVITKKQLNDLLKTYITIR